MKININEYHLKYRNLLRENVTTDTVVGAQPFGKYVLLAGIDDDPIHNLKDQRMKIMREKGQRIRADSIVESSSALKQRTPIVFRVLNCGPDVTRVAPDDLVSITFIAGDKFAGSPVVACLEEDIVFKFGVGLELSESELNAKAAQFNELMAFFQEQEQEQKEKRLAEIELKERLAAKREAAAQEENKSKLGFK